MEVFGSDWILGDFQASDYGLMLASFTYTGESEDAIGFNISINEEYIGHNPVPLYLGQDYNEKLKPVVTLIKNPCVFKDDLNFTENDCRAILRKVVGYDGYQWMRLLNDKPDEKLWYKSKVINVSYKRVAGKIVGVILEMECDSCFAWSKEYVITINAKADTPFSIYNYTDDLYNYVLPTVTIITSVDGELRITNNTENKETVIQNTIANENITLDSKNELISSNRRHPLLLNDFNLCWVRLVPNKNEFVINQDVTIAFTYRLPRKVGFV